MNNNKPEIVPFWLRLRAFSTFPFRGGALYSVLALTGYLSFCGMIPGIAGLILVAIGWAAALKYAFEILRQTADGRLDAPEVVLGQDNSVVGRFVALQILALVVPMVVALWLKPALGIALYVLFALAQPAAIMTLAMTQSLRAALSPGFWGAIVSRIGWSYLALIGLLVVMQLSAVNASSLIAHVLPAFFASIVALGFTLWALFATFHLMGYMLWQYHEELGLEPKTITEAVGLPFNRDRELLEAAGRDVQDGNPKAAIARLREEMRSRAVSSEVHELYRRLLQQAGERAALIENGPLFLHLLLVEKQEKKALALARECLDLDADFVPLQYEDGARLAERAAFAGQSKLAIDLLLALIRKHPRDPQMPAWTLRAVDLMLRQPGREAEARALVQQARAGCDDASLAERLDQQLAGLPA